MRTSTWIIESLRAQGVDTLFGVSGANIEDVFEAALKNGMRAVLSKHEHGAGTMADGYARAGHRLGVALATSGGGALNLVASLGEASSSRVPLLALIGQPPTTSRGQGAFQETSGLAGTFDLTRVFAPLCKFSGVARTAAEVPALLESAYTSAMTHPRGPVVILLPKDVQGGTVETAPLAPLSLPSEPFAVESLPEMSGRVGWILGEEIWKQGLAGPARVLAERMGATVAVTTEGRGGFDEDHAQFAGVVGVMGQVRARARLADCDVIWVLGTRLGAMERYGIENLLAGKPLLDIGPEAGFIHSANARHVAAPSLAAFFRTALGQISDPGTASANTTVPLTANARRVDSAPDSQGALSLANLAFALQPLLGTPGARNVIDAGNAVAALTYGIQLGADSRWITALGMGGMGYSFGAAVGVALATGAAVTVFAGDGAFYMHGLEMHTAIELDLPICFIIADNRGHGMCESREELFFDRPRGMNRFKESGLAAGLARFFPSLPVFEASSVSEVHNAAAAIPRLPGPKALILKLPPGEMPPFAPFQDALEARRQRKNPV